MRKAEITRSAHIDGSVHRVVSAQELQNEWTPELRLAVHIGQESDVEAVSRLRCGGLSNLGWIESNTLQPGDVFVMRRDGTEATVLFRESDRHHALFLTNRCNSRCLMCSQPPTSQDDSWLVQEALETIRHMRRLPSVLGITGGEPTLLGMGLRHVIDAILRREPSTRIEVLTNGRLLGDKALADSLLRGLPPLVSWLVPLYGHVNFLHDFVVQSPGAFDETLNGLLTLRSYEQPIQLRVVLIESVLKVLPELCAFVGRNLPFVREVSMMAVEPIGFALANTQECHVDLGDWSASLENAARVLSRHGVRQILMNVPLCALPETLWPAAQRSISDWKNIYPEECRQCRVRELCCGTFAWSERTWRPTAIKAIEKAAT